MFSFEEALIRVRTTARPVATEILPLAQADYRILRAPVLAADDDPPFAKSAVDGYAVDETTRLKLPGEFAVAAIVHAGDPPPAKLAGRVVKVMTGAPLPDDAAAMVMVEQSVVLPERMVRLETRPAGGFGLLARGENHRKGAPLLAPGDRLTPAAIGAAAHAGVGEITVSLRPRLTLLPTGNELVAAGVTPGPGQIVNSSAPALAALLAEAGAAVTMGGIVRDDPDALCAAITAANGDVVLTGGVSMGDADHLPAVAAALGFHAVFHKVAMKPGKPLLFCVHEDGRTLFGLPGNPVSSFLSARLFIAPWLRVRLGAAPEARRRALLADALRGAGERTHLVPVRLDWSGAALLLVPLPTRGSADLGSWRAADGAAIVPAGVEKIAAGEPCEFIPLTPWG